MLTSTVARLQCPRPKGRALCNGVLDLVAREQLSLAGEISEVRSGHLECERCRTKYPILVGVALLAPDVGSYLVEHVKGIAKLVPEAQLPKEHRKNFRDALSQLPEEHLEEDLEAERVIALYFMNHYLHAAAGETWWIPREQPGSPLIDSLVREHWDHGPFARIGAWVAELSRQGGGTAGHLIELGCSTGGLLLALRKELRSYLGVDTSFASVALARHLALGFAFDGGIRVPEDLLEGPVSRGVSCAAPVPADGTADFIVGDLALPPLRHGLWDVAVALNAIDMLDDPADQPRLQYDLLKIGGVAVHSCPYIWRESVASELRRALPAGVARGSAAAVEWLYGQEGFAVEKRLDHVPWLFFKHARQLEIYSVHLMTARKLQTT